MAFKQPRIPEYRESEGAGRYLRSLVLFLKDFCMECWTAVRTLEKGRQAWECGSLPRNLLDNSDFTNPVNQRGIVSISPGNSSAFFFDRWDASRVVLSASADGLSLCWDGAAGAYNYGWIRQKINTERLFGKTITVVYTFADGTRLAASGEAPAEDGEAKIIYQSADYHIRLTNTSGSCLAVVLLVYTKTPGIIQNAAVYEGGYTADNLPPYVPKGYDSELWACYYYFQRFTRILCSGQISNNTKGLMVNIPLYRAMRIDPTASIDGGGIVVRTPRGYVTDATWNNPFYAFVVTLTTQAGVVNMERADAGVWPNADNNTPATVCIGLDDEAVLSLSADL